MPLKRRFSEPDHRFGRIFLDPFPPLVAPADPILRVAVPLHCRFSEPAERLLEVVRSAAAGGIAEPQFKLGKRIPLLRGFLEPFQGGLRIPRNAVSVFIEFAQPVLRGGVPLIGGLLIPAGGLDPVGSDPLGKIVAAACPVLGFGMPLFGGLPEEFERAHRILVRAGIVVVFRETELGFGIPLFGLGFQCRDLFLGKGYRFGREIGFSGKVVVGIVVINIIAAGLRLFVKLLFDFQIVGRGVERLVLRTADKRMKSNHIDECRRQNNHQNAENDLRTVKLVFRFTRIPPRCLRLLFFRH